MLKTKTRHLTSCCVSVWSVAMMKHAELTLVECECITSTKSCSVSKHGGIFLRAFGDCIVWIKSLFSCVYVFVLPCLGADLRRPSAELRYVSAVAIPQSGLCPHALSLHHRPGGHVFPGHCPVFPGWQREGRETVSDSDIVWITCHYFIHYSVIPFLNISYSLEMSSTDFLSKSSNNPNIPPECKEEVAILLVSCHTVPHRGQGLYLDNAIVFHPCAWVWPVSGTSRPAVPTMVPTLQDSERPPSQ